MLKFKNVLFLISVATMGVQQPVFSVQPEIIRLEQGWSPQQRADYYWTTQGSALISYDIYLALKVFNSDEFFNSASHSNKVGLLTDPPDIKNNPDQLPIGITRTAVTTGQFKGVYMGMTCAACHTGQVQYKGKQIRIDGGAGNRFNIVEWIRSLSDSLNQTVSDPKRYEALVKEIKKSNNSIDEAGLKKRLLRDAEVVNQQVKYSFVLPSLPGPGRVDALGSIHNSFMGINTGNLENIFPASAPVKPPFLWNAPQSAWVQWSGIAKNPISRNFGESLGVFAKYDLKSDSSDPSLFESTSDIKQLVKLETLLKNLAPPQWPEHILGKLDQAKVRDGERLFAKNCMECHTAYPYRWSAERAPGKRFIENAMVPVNVIGTDDTQFKSVAFSPTAETKTNNLAVFFDGKKSVPVGEFNYVIQKKMVEKAVLKAGPFSKEEFAIMNNFTSFANDPPAKTPHLSYKAGPREGIWATGPFLHNGSVPNIFELLSPESERSKYFYVSREFDPVKLGINTSSVHLNDYLFDTTLVGNSNAGHSFDKSFDQKIKPKGVIGPELSHQERYAIIEYLKSIPNQAGRVTPYGGPEKPLIAGDDKTWFNFKYPFNGQVGGDYVRSH